MHEMIALIFKLQYRGKLFHELFSNPDFAFALVQFHNSMGGDRLQDFFIGWAVHIPFISKEGNLPQIETQFDLIMGPGSTLTGEMLWD